MLYEKGNVIMFRYNDKVRSVHITRVRNQSNRPYLITGWDHTANGLVGDYRSFHTSEITFAKKVGFMPVRTEK